MTDEDMLLRKLKYPPAMSMALNKDHLYSMMADIMKEAADRIEALLEGNKGLAEAFATVSVKREMTEAKLAKAVEALRSYVSKEKGVWNTADAVLAELEKAE